MGRPTFRTVTSTANSRRKRMRNLTTTVAVYDGMSPAETDWDSVEEAAVNGVIDLADAALVTRGDDGLETVNRHSHHGWGKGAVAGAVVGILFPPTLIAGAAVGAAGGGVLARLNRSLDRGDVKDLGEVMDSGTIALVVLTSQETAAALPPLLAGSTKHLSRDSSTAEDVMAALQSQPAS